MTDPHGFIIRHGRHACRPPAEATGAIFRCRCGRRWVSILDMRTPTGQAWRRAMWPARLSRTDAR